MSQAESLDSAAPLENYANNSSPSLRASRYERRGILWRESSLERVRKCGRVLRGDAVALRITSGAAGFSGLTTCGSVWADPVCNAKIMARRALEIGASVAIWQSQERPVAFVTFTMRHHRGQGLGDLWNALQRAWARVTQGNSWVRNQERFGIAGWLRVVEVTFGPNGWHVHVHALFFLEHSSPADLALMHRSMFGRWSAGLAAAGLAAPLLVGQDARLISGPADIALREYFTKATDRPRAIGLEMTQTQSKQARFKHSTDTPWRFLDSIQAGDADALDLWHEWERFSKGRRQVTWATGFRRQLLAIEEPSDEQIAAEEIGTEEDSVVYITPDGWANLCGYPADLAHLLTTAETSGLQGVRLFLDSRAVDYRLS